MATLKLGNSYSQLSGLSVGQYRQIKDAMSYYVDSGPGTLPRKVSLLSKKLEFPTGLAYLLEGILTPSVIDTRIRPVTPVDAPGTLFMPGRYITPYFDQTAAVEALMPSGRGLIVAPTGCGKSLIIALAIDTFKVKTLVVVPSLELKRQLTSNLLHWFGHENCNRFVRVANIDSLDPNKPLTDTGMLIVDELHHVAAKSYRDLNKRAWTGVYYRLGLTATPFRSSEDERLLFESFLANEIYRIPYRRAVEQGYVVPMECYYLEATKFQTIGNQKHYGAMYSENIVQNKQRNKMIAVALARLHSQKKSTLCLVREIQHGEILSNMTGLPFANGKDGFSEQLIKGFNQGEIKSLIATVGVCGEGVDTKPAEWVIIAGAGKARTQFMQQVGRAFRTYPGKETCKVLLIKDQAHPWFRKHSREQMQIVREEYEVEPLLLEL